MVRWLRILLGLALILIPEPTLITDALGMFIIAGALLPPGFHFTHPFGSCRCYYCVTGLARPVFL